MTGLLILTQARHFFTMASCHYCVVTNTYCSYRPVGLCILSYCIAESSLFISHAWSGLSCCRKMSVRLSVCLSVTRRYCVETAKHFLTLFSLSGNHTSLVFPHQTLWQWWGPRANRGVQCRGGYEKIAIILDQYKLSLYRGNDTRQDHKANRKPYPSFRMVPFSTTLSDI